MEPLWRKELRKSLGMIAIPFKLLNSLLEKLFNERPELNHAMVCAHVFI